MGVRAHRATRQRERHGKPHREQNRIGPVEGQPSGLFQPAVRVGCVRPAGNAGPRRMAATFSAPQGARATEPGLQAFFFGSGWQFSFFPATPLFFFFFFFFFFF